MIVNGRFCIYKGIEYKLNRDKEGNLIILTSQKDKVDSTFVDKYQTGVYSKVITIEDLDKVYEIRTICTYNGIPVGVRKEYQDSVMIGVSDKALADILNLERTDKYLYEGIVSKELLEIKVEKKDIEL